MDGLIFLGVLIFFSMLDAALRKKKAAGGGLQLPPPEEWEEEETHGVDPGGIPGEAQTQYAEPYGVQHGPAPTTSEALIPKDIWEEVAAIAAGSGPTEPPPEPEPEPEPEFTALQRSRQRDPVVPRSRMRDVSDASHLVHRAHDGFGTDPSERAPSEQDGSDRLAQHLSADASAIRKQLGSLDGHELRQAMILHEVLGPPAAYRED